jgi:hypothetical protein
MIDNKAKGQSFELAFDHAAGWQRGLLRPIYTRVNGVLVTPSSVRSSRTPAASLISTPPVARNCWQGFQTHAIAHMSLDNAIVNQSPVKGKVYNDVLQLRNTVQEVRQGSERKSAFPLFQML